MPTIQHRRATAAQWNAADPVLAAGEFGFEIDTNAVKIGDGLTPWKTLPYLADESLKTLVETGRLSEAALNATYPTHAQLMEVATGQDAALTGTAVAGVLGTEGDPARLVVDGLIDGAIADKADLIDGLIDPAQLIGTGETYTGIRIDTSVGTRVFVGNVMIHGDTGWRDVSATILEGWYGQIWLRRLGSMVLALVFDLERGDASSNVLNLYAGFRPTIYGVSGLNYGSPYPLADASSPTTELGGYLTLAGGGHILRASYQSGITGLQGDASWPTTESWPSALPGTPV